MPVTLLLEHSLKLMTHFLSKLQIPLIMLVVLPLTVDGRPAELEKLDASYQRKINEVGNPHRVRLISDLLVKEHSLTQADKLEAALAIRKKRVACTLVTTPNDFLKIVSVGDPQIGDAVQRYLRHYYAAIRPWEQTYINEMRKLERNLSSQGRLEDAIRIKKSREEVELARTKRENPERIALNLEKFLPGRVYDYRGRENRGPKEIHFLQSGSFYDCENMSKGNWKIVDGTVILKHPKYSEDTHITFAKDGLSYKGRLSKTGRRRSGKFKELREEKYSE